MSEESSGTTGRLVLDFDPALVSLIEEVKGQVLPGQPLDTGDLLAASLLDPATADLIFLWYDAKPMYDKLVSWLRTRDRSLFQEGGNDEWLLAGTNATISLTTWASFVLRFLPTCQSGVYILTLIAGLAELRFPSVMTLFNELHLDPTLLCAKLESRTIRMLPLIPGRDDPYYKQAMQRFYSWCGSGSVSRKELLRSFESHDLMFQAVMSWLRKEYDELDRSVQLRHGDIGLFLDGSLRDVCVYDKGEYWRSLTGQTFGEGIALAQNLMRVFRRKR